MVFKHLLIYLLIALQVLNPIGTAQAISGHASSYTDAEEGAKFSDAVYKAASFAGAALLLKQARGKIKPGLGKGAAKTSASVMETATTSRAARWVAEGEVSQQALKLGKKAEGYVPTDKDILHAIRSARVATEKGKYNPQYPPPPSPITTTTTSPSSAKEILPLMSTEFSKQSRNYIKDMETRSGMSIPFQQRIILKETLQKQKFDILEGEAKLEHKKQFDKIKNNLITEWQNNTKQEWPVYKENLYNKKGGIMAEVGERLQVHHIIPQQHGGPHEWWNIHPLTIPDHQGGVHAGNSALRKMLKDNLK